MNFVMRKNKIKTYIIIGIMMAAFVIIGYYGGYYYYGNTSQGILTALIAFFVYLAISLVSAQAFVLSLAKAKKIEPSGEYAELFRICEKLAQINDLPLPKLYVVEDPTANAFACGISHRGAAVAVHTGLLQRLNSKEVEAVLAHEFTHIKNLDVRVTTIVASLASALILVSRLALRPYNYSRSRDNDKSSGIFAIFSLIAVIVLPFALMLLQMAVSRKREYMADAGSVATLHNGRYLISALEKISGQGPSTTADKSCAAFYFSHPFGGDNLFSTHPSLKNRINAIEEAEEHLLDS